ncbi:hypothetical protein KBB27_02075 [Patescibacteria group bacterium]|nr:hypothetical protein [Patescibacteria group bacterium]
MKTDDESVRGMFEAVPVYHECLNLSKCPVDWAKNIIGLPELSQWAEMTPAARRQLVRMTGVEEKEDVPEAWDAFKRAIEGAGERYFIPRLALSRDGTWYLQAFCGPDLRPPSEVHLAETLSDALARYAGPEHEGDRHDVRCVEVTSGTTMVAVTSSPLLILGREQTFVYGYCAEATHGTVAIKRFWRDLHADLSFVFAESGDTYTSYVYNGDIRGAMRRAGIGIAHDQGKRFEVHAQALRAASKCPERYPLRMIDKLREQNVPNVVLDMASEHLLSPRRDGSRLSVARAIAYVAEKGVAHPELRLTLQRVAGAYLLATPKP